MNGVKSKVFDLKDEQDIIVMVLWLATTDMCPHTTPERVVEEVIVDGVHFKSNKHLNPCDWMAEIRRALKKKDVKLDRS